MQHYNNKFLNWLYDIKEYYKMSKHGIKRGNYIPLKHSLKYLICSIIQALYIPVIICIGIFLASQSIESEIANNTQKITTDTISMQEYEESVVDLPKINIQERFKKE